MTILLSETTQTKCRHQHTTPQTLLTRASRSQMGEELSDVHFCGIFATLFRTAAQLT